MRPLNFIRKILKVGMFNPRNYGAYGEKVYISSDTVITKPENVYLYGNNGLKAAVILSNSARFVMKKYAGASYGLKVSTANHARIIGIPWPCVKQDMKPQNSGKDVIVEEDVWMGFNVTLLSGVIVRRGTTVAAGAVVTNSTPPYCIVGGVPAKFIKFYWTIDEIIEHESMLYPEAERYSRTQLENIYKEYTIKV